MSLSKYMPKTAGQVAESAKNRFKELEHKGWQWSSFYNGYLEGFDAFRRDFSTRGYHVKREDALIEIRKNAGDLYSALKEMLEGVGDGPCYFDHHGNCQEHSWFGIDGVCPVAEAKVLVDKLKRYERIENGPT